MAWWAVPSRLEPGAKITMGDCTTHTTSSISSGVPPLPTTHIQRTMERLLDGVGLRTVTVHVDYEITVHSYRVVVEDGITGRMFTEILRESVADFATMTALANSLYKQIERHRSTVMAPPITPTMSFHAVPDSLTNAELKEVRRMLAAFKKATEDAGQSQ